VVILTIKQNLGFNKILFKMKILTIIRRVLVGIMIGISCLFPVPVRDTHPQKFQVEVKEDDDDMDD